MTSWIMLEIEVTVKKKKKYMSKSVLNASYCSKCGFFFFFLSSWS